ncbi:hypothetical protein HPB50_016937 [Hyalomma asiaticum]|uniref:Uncharacterized protein n=1 Tax=Hyalomma asiaticum TaxID=266040 RepID=A0ACB7SZA2_HYAAI|nr:hypothetical protein HPB50_016937 [Hyalomma asiaticum]
MVHLPPGTCYICIGRTRVTSFARFEYEDDEMWSASDRPICVVASSATFARYRQGDRHFARPFAAENVERQRMELCCDCRSASHKVSRCVRKMAEEPSKSEAEAVANSKRVTYEKPCFLSSAALKRTLLENQEQEATRTDVKGHGDVRHAYPRYRERADHDAVNAIEGQQKQQVDHIASSDQCFFYICLWP